MQPICDGSPPPLLEAENSFVAAAAVLAASPFVACDHRDAASWTALALASRGCRRSCSSKESLRAAASALPSGESAARRRLWLRLCAEGREIPGAEEASYRAYAAAAGDCDVQIRRDVGRTFPQELCNVETEALFRVLRAVSQRLEVVGYCQGMNFVAGVLVRVFGADGEESAYECLFSILIRHGMSQYFGHGFPKLRLATLQFDCLVEAFLPEVSAVLEKYKLSAEFYATQWFLTLFSTISPFAHVLRIWDHFLCLGVKLLHRVGLALLSDVQTQLVCGSFEETVDRLRSIGSLCSLSPDGLLKSALEFRVTNRLLCELEHALLSGDGKLPHCFPSRDLDKGVVTYLVVNTEPSCSSKRSSTMAATPAEMLPSPRIPEDSAAPLTPPPLTFDPPARKQTSKKKGVWGALLSGHWRHKDKGKASDNAQAGEEAPARSQAETVAQPPSALSERPHPRRAHLPALLHAAKRRSDRARASTGIEGLASSTEAGSIVGCAVTKETSHGATSGVGSCASSYPEERGMPASIVEKPVGGSAFVDSSASAPPDPLLPGSVDSGHDSVEGTATGASSASGSADLSPRAMAKSNRKWLTKRLWHGSGGKAHASPSLSLDAEEDEEAPTASHTPLSSAFVTRLRHVRGGRKETVHDLPALEAEDPLVESFQTAEEIGNSFGTHAVGSLRCGERAAETCHDPEGI